MSEVADRFWTKVDRNGPVLSAALGPCWVWTASRVESGYGRFMLGGRVQRAHRVAWRLSDRPLSDADFVLHSCDNPPCVNPAHLFLGTHADNMRDMSAKRRHPSRLTPASVRDIRRRRASGESGRGLAREYGVSTRLIRLVVKREEWAYVE